MDPLILNLAIHRDAWPDLLTGRLVPREVKLHASRASLDGGTRMYVRLVKLRRIRVKPSICLSARRNREQPKLCSFNLTLEDFTKMFPAIWCHLDRTTLRSSLHEDVSLGT
jgi:hypothetical protein